MLKMTIDNEEVLSDNDISIKEEILSPSSTILNNVYPKSWELDKDYTSRFYYPKDYSKLNIQNFNIEPEEAGKTIQINGSATLNDVDTSKESRVLRILGQTSQTGTPTPSSPIPVNVVSGNNEIDICGRNLANPSDIYDGYPTGNNGGRIGFNPSANSITYRKCTYVVAGQPYTLSWKPNTPKAEGSRDIKIVNNNNIILENFAYFNTNGNRTRTFTPNYSGWVYAALDTNATEVQIEKGSTATTYEPYIGNTYPIYLGVKNLFDGVFRQGTHVNTSTANCLCSDNQMKSVSGKQYTFYTNLPSTFKYKIMNCTSNGTSTTVINDTNYSTSGSVSVNCTADGYLKILVKNNDDSNLTPSTIAGYTFQVGIGTNHVSSTPIELCKIGTYQDYIYKDNGSWYLHKEIGKVVLDGSTNRFTQTFSTNTSGINRYRTNEIPIKLQTSGQIANVYCDKLIPKTLVNTYNKVQGISVSDVIAMLIIYIDDIGTYTLEQANNWLSTNNLEIYYVLATPTTTEITDTTLLEQLESLSS